MQPAPIIVRMVQVGKARELERAARPAEAVIARHPHLAGVEDAHAKQLAIVLVRERQELRHGHGGIQSVTIAAAIRPTSRVIEAATEIMALLLRVGSSSAMDNANKALQFPNVAA